MVGGGGHLIGLIPPAEDHTKLCSVDLPQCPKAAAPAAALEPASFRDLGVFFLLSSVAIINTYLKGSPNQICQGSQEQ